jgi:hypothetical protein
MSNTIFIAKEIEFDENGFVIEDINDKKEKKNKKPNIDDEKFITFEESTAEKSEQSVPKQVLKEKEVLATFTKVDTKEQEQVLGSFPKEQEKCLNKIKEGELEVQCKRKAKKGSPHCKKCSEELKTQKEIEVKNSSGREVAINALFGLQFSLYCNLQWLTSFADLDMSGLPQDLIIQQEQFKEVYGQIYDKYGPEFIEQYVGPGYTLALMTIGQVGNRLMINNGEKIKKGLSTSRFFSKLF